jgi:enoyl-CoA hydratase
VTVTLDVRDHTAVLTLDRPQARNAIDGDTAHQIEAHLDEIDVRDDIWVVVLTGSPPVFCAGADLKATKAGTGKSMFTPRGGFAGFTAREREKPVIAAVDGAALGGGTEIVLACDMVVASYRSSFGLPEVRRGLIASAGGLFRLPRKIPHNVAMECILTGGAISAERAHGFGLVNRLCADGAAVDVAVALAEEVATGAPVAVRASRRVVVDTEFAPDEQAWSASRAALRVAMGSADHAEGLAAFVEKRSPVWTGH